MRAVEADHAQGAPLVPPNGRIKMRPMGWREAAHQRRPMRRESGAAGWKSGGWGPHIGGVAVGQVLYFAAVDPL